MASGAPDWEKIVNIEAEVPLGTGAPDWERIVVGSGGTPIGGGGGSDWAPGDYGVLGWTENPFITYANWQSESLVSGTIYLSLLKVGKSGSTTEVAISNAATGSLTANQCYAGLYSATFSGGNLATATQVAVTAAGTVEGTTFAGTLVAFDWASSASVSAGTVMLFAMLVNFGGGGIFELQELPQFVPTLGASAPVWGTNYVAWASNASTYTSLPSSLSGSNFTTSGKSHVAVIS